MEDKVTEKVLAKVVKDDTRYESKDGKTWLNLSSFGICFGDKWNYNNKKAPKHVKYQKDGMVAELPGFEARVSPDVLLVTKKIDSWSSDKAVTIENVMAAEGDLSDLIGEALEDILVYNKLKKEVAEEDEDEDSKGN